MFVATHPKRGSCLVDDATFPHFEAAGFKKDDKQTVAEFQAKHPYRPRDAEGKRIPVAKAKEEPKDSPKDDGKK
jgi:hypothetical protein